MQDYTSIEACILKYGKTAEQIAQTGGHKQATAQEVMDTLDLVGQKITEGAKAFLYKEYIWLTIWSCSFAIVLGSTVDLLEMGMERAPTNFPYTATSYLTGSMTSILAGYIGMRIAVYTNTRVTFTCCTSVHKGFVTAFRGGQVLGFVLVGLGVLNIMIIILLFKACWYNEFLKEVLDAGRPINRCPDGDFKDVTQAQADLWAFFENQTYEQWKRNFGFAAPHGAWAKNSGTLAKPAYNGSDAITICDEAHKAECAKKDTADYVYYDTLSSNASFKVSDFFYTPSAGVTKTTAVTGAHPVASVDMTEKLCKNSAYGTHFSEYDSTGKATNACYSFTRESLCTLW